MLLCTPYSAANCPTVFSSLPHLGDDFGLELGTIVLPGFLLHDGVDTLPASKFLSKILGALYMAQTPHRNTSEYYTPNRLMTRRYPVRPHDLLFGKDRECAEQFPDDEKLFTQKA